MRWLIVALGAVLIGGCQPAYLNGEPNPDSPYYRIPTESRVMLEEAVSVPPRSDRVYFQDGRQLRWYDVDRYRPYCALALRSKSDDPRTIEADTFTVRDRDLRYLYGVAQAGGVRDASMFDDDGGMEYQVQAVELTLESRTQPLVEGLICASWRLPQGAASVTLRDIRNSLGERFTLELNEERTASAPLHQSPAI